MRRVWWALWYGAWLAQPAELDRLESWSLQREALRTVRGMLRTQPGFTLTTVAFVILGLGLGGAILRLGAGPPAAWLMVAVALYVMRVWHYRRDAQHILRQFLFAHGHATCLACGYDLSGQSVPRCPECGSAFDPRLCGTAMTRDVHRERP